MLYYKKTGQKIMKSALNHMLKFERKGLSSIIEYILQNQEKKLVFSLICQNIYH